jgi:membrane dipeptidase
MCNFYCQYDFGDMVIFFGRYTSCRHFFSRLSASHANRKTLARQTINPASVNLLTGKPGMTMIYAGRRAMLKKILISAGIVVCVVLLLAFTVLTRLIDAGLNGIHGPEISKPSAQALSLVKHSFIADMHCDALICDRDLLKKNGRGHVDIPRLIEGSVALETFSIVSKAPMSMMDLDHVSDRGDLITCLIIAQRWPRRTWFSLKERALYQAEKLHTFARSSGGRCAIITSVEDLDQYLERRKKNTAITAGLLSIEGAQVLEGDPDNIEALHHAGFRMMSPTHFFDTDMSGSAHGLKKYGLTPKGRTMIRRMEEKGMIVDLAHASPRTIDDILAMATKPPVVSHTGVRGVCDTVRNISDRHIRAIAQKGGVIGIGFFSSATCGESVTDIVRSIRYAVDRAGITHVGLGSDYDGAVYVPFDAAGMAYLADALLKDGFSEQEVRLIMGGNVLRLLRQTLPAK